MITYKRCCEVSKESIYNAFALGFSDYVVPLTLNINEFIARFFGPEGNSLNLSFIAFDDDRPIGLILGGIRIFDGVKTMRCGTLCIAPDYREKGIARKLMDYHLEAAISENCRCVFLEVIQTNTRAVEFYKKSGYTAMNSLKYYSIKREDFRAKPNAEFSICSVDINAIAHFRDTIKDIHINWQSEIACFANSMAHVYLLAKNRSENIGYIAMSALGKVEQLYVDMRYRNRGMAANLIASAANQAKAERISICLPNNASLECFLVKSNFVKDSIEQFEMYKPI